MNSSSPRVSVIILTFNARRYIEECLASVLNQPYPNFEVILVDNASADGTAEFVGERFSSVRLLLSPTNCGYGAGNNLGAAEAEGDVLVFLNPDAVPEPRWLERLVESMRQHGRQLATSKITLLANRDRLNSAGNLIHFLGLSFCRGVNAHQSGFDRPELVSGASGAAFAITRDLFQRLGGFDGSLFLYHDDVDLSLRALLAGERCLYVPDAVVAHDYDLVLPPTKWGWVEAHRYAVVLKTFKPATLLVLLPALLAMDLLTLAHLMTRGPAFVRAKFSSYGWVIRNAPTILDGRRRAQATRAVSDRQILSVLTDQIPYEQLAPAWLALVAHWLIDPWFRLYRALTLKIVNW